jgi:hypothetical protein
MSGFVGVSIGEPENGPSTMLVSFPNAGGRQHGVEVDAATARDLVKELTLALAAIDRRPGARRG